jgi:hypothetical protein
MSQTRFVFLCFVFCVLRSVFCINWNRVYGRVRVLVFQTDYLMLVYMCLDTSYNLSTSLVSTASSCRLGRRNDQGAIAPTGVH